MRVNYVFRLLYVFIKQASVHCISVYSSLPMSAAPPVSTPLSAITTRSGDPLVVKHNGASRVYSNDPATWAALGLAGPEHVYAVAKKDPSLANDCVGAIAAMLAATAEKQNKEWSSHPVPEKFDVSVWYHGDFLAGAKFHMTSGKVEGLTHKSLVSEVLPKAIEIVQKMHPDVPSSSWESRVCLRSHGRDLDPTKTLASYSGVHFNPIDVIIAE